MCGLVWGKSSLIQLSADFCFEKICVMVGITVTVVSSKLEKMRVSRNVGLNGQRRLPSESLVFFTAK